MNSTSPNLLSTHEDEEERAIAERTQSQAATQAAYTEAKGGAGQPMIYDEEYDDEFQIGKFPSSVSLSLLRQAHLLLQSYNPTKVPLKAS